MLPVWSLDRWKQYDAQDVFIAGLNGTNFGGFNDWRMPTIKELASLLNRGVFNPSIDLDWFPNTAASVYWSSTAYASNNSNAWTVNFYDGTGFYSSKVDSRYVRTVRGGQAEANAVRIFNAAEVLYPNWFYPKGLPVETYKGAAHPMIFRYYQAKNIYLLTYEGVVYYYYNGKYTPWFTVNEWLTWLDITFSTTGLKGS